MHNNDIRLQCLTKECQQIKGQIKVKKEFVKEVGVGLWEEAKGNFLNMQMKKN